MERRRKTVAAQPRRTAQSGPDDPDVEAVLQRDVLLDAKAFEQTAVRGAAPEEHVLAVVDVQPTPQVGRGEPAETPARLEEDDLVTRVEAVHRRRDTGQPATDDSDPRAHAALPARARIATPTLSLDDNDRRWPKTNDGSSWI